jgi:translation elongation factor EF-Tu-like GTPase
MTTIGLIGNRDVGKTTILRLFVKYNNKTKFAGVNGGKPWSVTKIDFSGETCLNPETANKETKTIHPNRVNFQEDDTKRSHTIFAPGGDKDWPVVKMGIITISRISKQIVTVFAADQSLSDQLTFFDAVRYFPKEIYVCVNKLDLIPTADRVKLIESMKFKIEKYFNKRRIQIRDYFYTCAEESAQNQELNDNSAKMILKIALDNIEKVTEYQRTKAPETIQESIPSLN